MNQMTVNVIVDGFAVGSFGSLTGSMEVFADKTGWTFLATTRRRRNKKRGSCGHDSDTNELRLPVPLPSDFSANETKYAPIVGRRWQMMVLKIVIRKEQSSYTSKDATVCSGSDASLCAVFLYTS